MSTAFKLRNGTILLSTEAPGGIYNAAQLKKLASLCDGQSVIIKATEDQRLALFVSPDSAPSIAAELQSIGLGIRHYQNGLHHPTSCIGELCPDHEQDALGSALDISQEFGDIQLETSLKIGINGCSKCCVPCHTLDISVIGDTSGYRVHLGGKSSSLPEMASFMAEGVPASELPRLLKDVVSIYKEHAQPNETLQELIDRDGSSAFIKALAPWSQDAAGSSAEESSPELGDTSDAASQQSDESDIMSADSASFWEGSKDSKDQGMVETDPAELPDAGELDFEVDNTNSELSLDENEGLPSTAVETLEIDGLSGSESDELAMTDTPLQADELNDQQALLQGADDLDMLAPEKFDELDIDPSMGEHEELQTEVPINIDDSDPSDDIELMSAPDESIESLAESVENEIPEMVENSDPKNDINDLELDALEDPISDEQVAADVATTSADGDEIVDIDSTKSELDEAHFNAGDVLAGNQNASARQDQIVVESSEPTVSSSQIEELPELQPDHELMTDEAEAAYEQKISESIVAQQSVIVDDTAEVERNETLALMDQSDQNLPSEAEIEALDEDLDDGEIKSPQNDPSDFEIIPDHEESTFDIHEHLPLSEVVSTRARATVTPISDSNNSNREGQKAHGWGFSGIDVDQYGDPVITFLNGIRLTITSAAVDAGEMNIGGHHIVVRDAENGIEVTVDGMRMFMPNAA